MCRHSSDDVFTGLFVQNSRAVEFLGHSHSLCSYIESDIKRGDCPCRMSDLTMRSTFSRERSLHLLRFSILVRCFVPRESRLFCLLCTCCYNHCHSYKQGSFLNSSIEMIPALLQRSKSNGLQKTLKVLIRTALGSWRNSKALKMSKEIGTSRMSQHGLLRRTYPY